MSHMCNFTFPPPLGQILFRSPPKRPAAPFTLISAKFEARGFSVSEMIFGAIWNCRGHTDRSQRNPAQSTAETADFRRKPLKNIEKCRKNGAKPPCGYPTVLSFPSEDWRRMEREVPLTDAENGVKNFAVFYAFSGVFIKNALFSAVYCSREPTEMRLKSSTTTLESFYCQSQ